MTPTAHATAAIVRWIAGPDGVAHIERGRLPRAECGVAATGEQHSWPTRQRCLECLSIQATSALPEELLLAGYGVRRETPIG